MHGSKIKGYGLPSDLPWHSRDDLDFLVNFNFFVDCRADCSRAAQLRLLQHNLLVPRNQTSKYANRKSIDTDGRQAPVARASELPTRVGGIGQSHAGPACRSSAPIHLGGIESELTQPEEDKEPYAKGDRLDPKRKTLIPAHRAGLWYSLGEMHYLVKTIA